MAQGSAAVTLARLGMGVTLVEPDEAALDRVLQGLRVQVNAVRAERPPEALAGRFSLVLLHARDALGDDVAATAREFLAPEGRVAFVRPVRVLLRPPPGLLEQWERHWGVALRTPQELLASLPRAGYEPDFAETLGLVDEIGFSGAFSFKYSPRPGTPGAEMDDQVDETAKSERLQRLQQAIDRSQADFNRSCVGRTVSVLFERPGRYSGQIVGRSPYLQPVQVEAPASLIGKIAPVSITDVASNSLFGALTQQPALAGAGA